MRWGSARPLRLGGNINANTLKQALAHVPAGAFAARAVHGVPRLGRCLANLTIKKIPKTVLSRCEWGRDDYSLEVANLAQAPHEWQQIGGAARCLWATRLAQSRFVAAEGHTATAVEWFGQP